MEVSMGKIAINGGYSIAMFDYWRVNMYVACSHSIPQRSWRMTSCFQRLRQSPSCGIVRISPSGLLQVDFASYGKLWQAMAYGTVAFSLFGCIQKCIGETISIVVSPFSTQLLCNRVVSGWFYDKNHWKSDCLKIRSVDTVFCTMIPLIASASL